MSRKKKKFYVSLSPFYILKTYNTHQSPSQQQQLNLSFINFYLSPTFLLYIFESTTLVVFLPYLVIFYQFHFKLFCLVCL